MVMMVTIIMVIEQCSRLNALKLDLNRHVGRDFKFLLQRYKTKYTSACLHASTQNHELAPTHINALLSEMRPSHYVYIYKDKYMYKYKYKYM